MIFQKIKNQIKKYFAAIFDTQKKERGFAVSTLIIGSLLLGGGAGILWYFKVGIGQATLSASGTLILGIARFLFKMAQGLFEAMGSSDILQRSITRDSMVLHGWAIVRDFANMFVVLGFVVVGIATILRIRAYEAQKTLLPLILVALLINFSLLICGIIIDGTNITMNYFTKISGPANITQHYSALITDPLIDNKLQLLKGANEWGKYASFAFSTAMYIGITAMIFFIYGILLLFRYVALMLLVILSPLAFVCYVFPATKAIFDKWWQQFTQWAIIGIPTAFFIYLGGHLLQSMANQNNGIIAFWVPVGFMLFAYTLIFQTSAIGASAAMGLATGAVGFAAGKIKSGGGKLAKGGLKGLGNKTGITDKAKTMGGRALERIGLLSKGTTAQSAQKRMEERKKKIGARTEEQQVADAKGRAFTPEQIRNKIANTENLVKDKKLHKIGDTTEQAKAISLAESHAKSQGYNTTIREDAEKLNPELTKYNKNKIAEYTRPVAEGGEGLNQTQAELKYMTETIKKTSPAKATEWDAKIITPEVFGALGKNQLIEIGKRGSAASVEQIKKFKRREDQNGQALPNAQQSQEYQNLRNHLFQNYGENSPETNRVISLIDELKTNNIFA